MRADSSTWKLKFRLIYDTTRKRRRLLSVVGLDADATSWQQIAKLKIFQTFVMIHSTETWELERFSCRAKTNTEEFCIFGTLLRETRVLQKKQQVKIRPLQQQHIRHYIKFLSWKNITFHNFFNESRSSGSFHSCVRWWHFAPHMCFFDSFYAFQIFHSVSYLTFKRRRLTRSSFSLWEIILYACRSSLVVTNKQHICW